MQTDKRTHARKPVFVKANSLLELFEEVYNLRLENEQPEAPFVYLGERLEHGNYGYIELWT